MRMNAAEKLLAIGDALRTLAPEIRLESIVIFLLVCKNNGACFNDLVFQSQFTNSMVSRCLAYLHSIGDEGLVRLHALPDDRRRRAVRLTAQGLRVRQQIEDIIESRQAPGTITYMAGVTALCG